MPAVFTVLHHPSSPSNMIDDLKGALFISFVSVVNKGLFLYMGVQRVLHYWVSLQHELMTVDVFLGALESVSSFWEVNTFYLVERTEYSNSFVEF